MRTAIAAAFADSLDPKPLRTVYADTASRHPCVASSSATTVALPPFGRILQTILPTVCARHPAHFTGGLCIMHTDLYKQSLARARISLRPFTQPASCAPFCKHFPLPIFIRAAGKHLIRPAYHAQMSPQSRHVTTSTGINRSQRRITPKGLPTYTDKQCRPFIPSGRHGFLSAPTAASRTAVPNLTPSPHTVSIMPCPRGFRSPLWVAVKTFAASSGLFYLFGTTFNSFCRG